METSEGIPPSAPAVDPRSGFCSETKIFHSLRRPVPLPPDSVPLNAASFSLSLLPSPLPDQPALIDAATGASVTYPDLLARIRNLASALRSRAGLSKGHVAFLISPPGLDIPVLYLALLSIGAIVSPANPLSTPAEIAHQIRFSNPSVAFATAATAPKLPPHIPILLLDSPRFRSFFDPNPAPLPPLEILQSDTAAILCSSGTMGKVKGVALSHRNLVAQIASNHAAAQVAKEKDAEPPVALITVPLFHVFGYSVVLREVTLGETAVLMERFDFSAMLAAVERYQVNLMLVSPPLVLAMAKSPAVVGRDLSSLKLLVCGGAPLVREVAESFAARFPSVKMGKGYGLTESSGGIAGTDDPRNGSTGRISAITEARIVDPATGESLGPGQRGELWLRGPTIMKGYVGDVEATASTLDLEGWLKTGDLCYFDHEGFLYVVYRLNELIKYKAYQVPPTELEQILLSHPKIADAAVVPYPDEEAGQIPLAFVVRQPGSTITEEEVIDFVRKQVEPHKKVRRAVFISSIPKSLAGKILRRELINQALSLLNLSYN
ncbi:4-coumarate--CoA ligase-like 5 isoform X1 [Zingiber officinale]|uniref:4-coumarate--CoA ligase-like 5 isoform X1 n=1 Tax=Zingiber officinale TaxID=94328 RepID=UPI001C4CE59A|nr:4-coumarate--CoA ligase-like 5 isoform X1 [Zingiber officinale]